MEPTILEPEVALTDTSKVPAEKIIVIIVGCNAGRSKKIFK